MLTLAYLQALGLFFGHVAGVTVSWLASGVTYVTGGLLWADVVYWVSGFSTTLGGRSWSMAPRLGDLFVW